MNIPTGAGLILTDKDDLDVGLAAASGIRFVLVPVTYARARMNRDRKWYPRVHAAGIEVHCYSWLTTDFVLLTEAIAFAKAVGALSFATNNEKELRGHPALGAAVAKTARAACDKHGLSLGLISYSVPSTVGDFPWQPFAERCDYGMPEVYDREGGFDALYPPRADASWRDVGFRDIVAGCGAYQRDGLDAPFRWRTAKEIRRHLALFPETAGRAAWGLAGEKWPEGVLRALGEGPPK